MSDCLIRWCARTIRENLYSKKINRGAKIESRAEDPKIKTVNDELFSRRVEADINEAICFGDEFFET